MPYKLVRDDLSHDTIEALTVLLEGARTGEITGIAFACTMRRMRYFTNVAGVCYTNPTFARGMVCSLSDELAALIHTRDPGETR